MEGNNEKVIIEENPNSQEYFEDNEEYDEDLDEGEAEDYDYGGSEPSPLGGIYGLFKDTLDRDDSRKVSNLTKEELGTLHMSVRDCERIALIALTFRHPGVASFFKLQSRITTDTAMARDGWFSELFVTSKKYASRESSSSNNLPQVQNKKKWKPFQKKTSLPPAEMQ